MNHLSEEELVLYYYWEAAESAPAGDHLGACDECRDCYATLQRVLNTMDAAPVPERPADYGAAVWQRIKGRLPRRRFAWLFQPRRWAIAAAMAALLVAAFLTGRYTQKPPAPSTKTANVGAVRDRLLLVAVSGHLERSKTILAELENSNWPDISYAREAAADLVESNRLFRQTAATAGDVATASLLEDLERVLLEIANSPSSMSSRELQDLQKEIENRGILFKVKVFASEVEEREKRDQL